MNYQLLTKQKTLRQSQQRNPAHWATAFKQLFLLLCFIPAVVSADSFYIKQGQASSIATKTIEKLAKSELAARGHTIVNNELSSQWMLSVDAIELGDTYIVSLSKYREGIVEYSDKLRSNSIEDLDTVTARLVSGALDNVSADNSIAVDTVTADEVKGTTIKTKVTRQTFFGFGPSTLFNLDTNSSGKSFTAGSLWGVDDQFSIRAGFTTNNVSDSPADLTNISLGGHYYLNRKKHASYAVGLVGYTWAESDKPTTSSSFLREGESDSGWGVEAGIGSHFYRTATVNISAELTYSQAFFEVTDGAPGTLGAKLIVFW